MKLKEVEISPFDLGMSLLDYLFWGEYREDPFGSYVAKDDGIYDPRGYRYRHGSENAILLKAARALLKMCDDDE